VGVTGDINNNINIIICFYSIFNMNSLNFNIDNGYLEGLVRGFKAGILKQSDYANLVQCETLEGKYNMLLFTV